MIQAFQKPIEDQISFSSGSEIYESFFDGKGVAGTILIALITIYRLNFIASVLYLNPRHMFHSFPQYLFLVSTYVNILIVYSFNNWHDGSSGTKCSDKLDAPPSTDLTRGDDNEASVEEIEKEKEDIDTQFERTV